MIKKRAAIYLILYLVLLPLASCADVSQSIGNVSQFVGEWTAINTCDAYEP